MILLNLQSKLTHIGESRMEMDYKLVENEGLFQEYLEMGMYQIYKSDLQYQESYNYHQLSKI